VAAGREISVSSEISREIIIAAIAEENPVIFRETIVDFKIKDRVETIALVFKTEMENLKIGKDHEEENEKILEEEMGNAAIGTENIGVMTEDIITILGMIGMVENITETAGMGTDISIMDMDCPIIIRHIQDIILIQEEFVMAGTGLTGLMTIIGDGD
jgi:hypothetical protein